MSLVYPHGADHASVQAALKAHDPDLRLIPPGVMFDGRPAPERHGYRVYRWAGGDRPPEFLCFWGNDHLDPYPLSHGLVDLVKHLDRNTREKYLDSVAANAMRQAQIDRQVQRDNEALRDDYLPLQKRSPTLPRGQSLRRARDKQRAKGKKL